MNNNIANRKNNNILVPIKSLNEKLVSDMLFPYISKGNEMNNINGKAIEANTDDIILSLLEVIKAFIYHTSKNNNTAYYIKL